MPYADPEKQRVYVRKWNREYQRRRRVLDKKWLELFRFGYDLLCRLSRGEITQEEATKLLEAHPQYIEAERNIKERKVVMKVTGSGSVQGIQNAHKTVAPTIKVTYGRKPIDEKVTP